MIRFFSLTLLVVLTGIGVYLVYRTNTRSSAIDSLERREFEKLSSTVDHNITYQLLDKILLKGLDYPHPSKMDDWGMGPLLYHAPSSFYFIARGKETGLLYTFEVPQRTFYHYPLNVSLRHHETLAWHLTDKPRDLKPPASFYEQEVSTEETNLPRSAKTAQEQLEQLLQAMFQQG